MQGKSEAPRKVPLFASVEILPIPSLPERVSAPQVSRSCHFRLCLVSAWILFPIARIAQEAPKDVFSVQLAQRCQGGIQAQI